MTNIQMDGKIYRVRVVYNSLEESAALEEGINEGSMLSGRHERDLVGTFYGHSMDVERDPSHPQDYDALFDAMAAPVSSHTVVMPHGQGSVTYEAEVSAVRRKSAGVIGGVRRWMGMTVSFKSIRPVLVPEEEDA